MYRRTIACFVLAFLFFSCDGTGRESDTGAPAVSQRFGESTAPGGELYSSAYSQEAEAQKPLIELEPEYSIISLANVNFDLERNEEQVLAVRDKSAPESPIRIIVAAYDSVLETYRIVFEDTISAVNQRALHLSFLDVVGDHNLEIICRGMDAEGKQTIDIFHRAAAPTGFGLYYANIFSVSLLGSIEILELERSGAYQVGQANGESFPIVTQTQDRESENMLDLVQTTYYWRFTESRYTAGDIEKIPGEVVEQEQLRELYRKNASNFADFLHGSWFLAESPDSGATDTVILNFDSSGSSFTYFTGELQESYNWISTYKVLVSRVEINGENELVPFIRKQFYLQVESLDTVEIRGNDPWSGVYRRLSDSIARTMRTGKTGTNQTPVLAGTFYSDAGNELLFEKNSFRLIEDGKVFQGGFATYQAAAPVLELRIFNNAGISTESRRFRYTYTEEKRDDKIFKTLTLVPGMVGIYGFESTSDSVLRYEQIISADEE